MKKFHKKINFIFFVDEKKTHHFKINYILFVSSLASLILVLLAIIFFLYKSFFILEERNYLSHYVLNLKKFYLHNYFDSNFSGNTQDEIRDDSRQSDNPALHGQGSSVIADQKTQKPSEIKVEAPKEVAKNLALPIKVTSLAPPASQNSLVVPPSTGMLLTKSQITQEKEKISLSFSLTNLNKTKTLSGAICAQMQLKSSPGKLVTINYPGELIFGDGTLPTVESCIMGEHVKFNRLRPVVLNFPIRLSKETDFKLQIPQKVSVYFLENNAPKAFLVKEIKLN